MCSGVINALIPYIGNFELIKWLWMLNGFSLSILWPTLVRVLSENLDKEELGKSSVVMGTTVAVGTVIIYAISSLLAKFNMFRVVFSFSATTIFIVAIIWILNYNNFVSRCAQNMSIFIKTDVVKQNQENRWKNSGEKRCF